MSSSFPLSIQRLDEMRAKVWQVEAAHRRFLDIRNAMNGGQHELNVWRDTSLPAEVKPLTIPMTDVARMALDEFTRLYNEAVEMGIDPTSLAEKPEL